MGQRFRVTIRDSQSAKLPVVVDCDSVVALMESGGQAAFSTRGLTAGNLAQHMAAVLMNLYQFDPAVLATAIVLIREGRTATAGAARDATTGASIDVTVRNPKEVGAEILEVLRFAMEAEV